MFAEFPAPEVFGQFAELVSAPNVNTARISMLLAALIVRP
jgi:hypothetical protein